MLHHDRDEIDALLARTRRALLEHDVKASIGMAVRLPSIGLKLAWETADQRMYVEKRSRGR